MKKILNIITSIKGEGSLSIKLSNAILERLKAAYPDSSVLTRDLSKDPIAHLGQIHLGAFFTPADNRTDEQKEAVRDSDQSIQALKEADIIVIGVALYNFGITSTLKAWIDHVARAGQTFRYGEDGPVGLVTGKKVYLAIATGGIYSDGPMKSHDFTESYLRTILGFIGLTDITVFRVEGTGVPEFKETALTKALAAVDEFTF